MAVDQEARDLINSILAEFSTRWDGGTWGIPRDFSMLVRQEQPPASGASQFKGEDLQIDAGDIVLRDTGDIVATKISELTEKVTPVATDWLLLQQTDGTFRRVSATTLMSLTSQQVRDAMKLAPSGGGPSAGSIDEHLDNAALSSEISALNDLSAAQVNAEVDSAIVTYHLDHLFAADYDPASKPGVATALLNELVESDGGVSRFTTNALEQGPTGSGASASTIADAVWDELDADHTVLGSYGSLDKIIDRAIRKIFSLNPSLVVP